MDENPTLDIISVNECPAPPRGWDHPVVAVPGELDGGFPVPLDLSIVDPAAGIVISEAMPNRLENITTRPEDNTVTCPVWISTRPTAVYGSKRSRTSPLGIAARC